MAPINIDVVQSRPVSKWARTVTTPNVNGMPISSARVGSDHSRRSRETGAR